MTDHQAQIMDAILLGTLLTATAILVPLLWT